MSYNTGTGGKAFDVPIIMQIRIFGQRKRILYAEKGNAPTGRREKAFWFGLYSNAGNRGWVGVLPETRSTKPV